MMQNQTHGEDLSLITKLKLCEMLSVSEASVDRWLRSDCTFPQPRRLGPNSIRWIRNEVDTFIRNLSHVPYDDRSFDPGAE